jgi:hypothetical protein
MSEENEEFIPQVFQSNEPQHIPAPSREFKPWHRERKQFIREHQWNLQAERLINRYLSLTTDIEDVDENAPDNVQVPSPLRCFMLPGDDLLDVRSLWQRVNKLGCFIKYIGFNSSQGSKHEGSRVYVATNAVNSLDKVVRSSEVLHDRFQSVGNPKSVAHQRMRDAGPYHIINLDICDSLFPVTTNDPSEYYNALREIAQFQCESCTHPWLLFVTTQVEPSLKDNDGLKKLSEAVYENCGGSTEFTDSLHDLLSRAVYNAGSSGLDLRSLTDEEMCRFFGVAFGKWLLQLIATATPPWSVRLLASYRYTIKEGVAPMFSFAFLFQRHRPLALQDKTGLARSTTEPEKPYEEKKYALNLIKAVNNIRDVEKMLAEDPALKNSVTESAVALMEAAGFDREQFLEFLKSTETN